MTRIEYLQACIRQANAKIKGLGLSGYWDENYTPPEDAEAHAPATPATPDVRHRQLEGEWMCQSKWNDFTNWLIHEKIPSLASKVAEAEPTTPEWISVEERLPEFSGMYNIAVHGQGDNGEDYTGTLSADWFSTDKRWHDLRGWGHHEVTHWRPLPDPPGAGQGRKP